jgi:hypothetical protein
MDRFAHRTLYLHTHPGMLDQLEFAFRIKYWVLLALAFYFILLPHRHSKKKSVRKLDDDQFLP